MKRNFSIHSKRRDFTSLKVMSEIESFGISMKSLRKPLSRGNVKLSKRILIFSLLPVVTCPNCKDCKGSCYAVRDMRYNQAYIKWLYNTYLAFNKIELLESLINGQLKRSRTVKYVRVHGAGDFFSDAYIDMWVRIAKNNPGIIFYYYTKANFKFDLSRLNALENVIDNPSILPDGSKNYGPLKDIQAKCKEYGIFLCPARVGQKDNIKCGEKCTACMSLKFKGQPKGFEEHGSNENKKKRRVRKNVQSANR